MLAQAELLRKYHLKIRGHLGQHLLMDPNMIRKIVDALDLKPGELVFEIGPGLGAVTQEILSRGFSVLAVEKDKKFIEILNQELAFEHQDRFQLIQGDILKADLSKLLSSHLRKGEKAKVIGNLPYYISTPIFFHLIDHAAMFSRAVLMFQKEVALRLSAKPGSKDYSRLSVTSRLYGKTRFLFDVSPACFLPHPEVMSRVIAFTFQPFQDQASATDRAFLLHWIQLAFSQRRKTLFSLIFHQTKPRIDRNTLEGIFQDIRISLSVRGEELSLEEFISLSNALSKYQGRIEGENFTKAHILKRKSGLYDAKNYSAD